MNYVPPYINYIVISILAFLLCAFSIPRIILISKRKKLFDLPDNNRKIHKEVVPNLGGIGIFFSTMIIGSFFISPSESSQWWHYVVASSLILFIIGVKDDILILTPAKKFMAQIVAATITVIFADIRLHSLHGILGINEMPYWFSVSFSIIGTIFVTNAFNLIDGVDGLAGSITALCSFILGVSLAFQGNINAAYFSFALLGAVIGFLVFNRSPAKIFMGDSGALFIGFSISMLSIVFINSFKPHPFFSKIIHSPQGALIVTLAILFVPVFDSFRVFLTRIAKRQHPFRADRIHLHHFLLDVGFSHNRIVTILLTANLMIITVGLLVQDYNPNIGIAAIIGLSIGLFLILYFKRKVKMEQIRISLESMKKSDSMIGDNMFVTSKSTDGGSSQIDLQTSAVINQ